MTPALKLMPPKILVRPEKAMEKTKSGVLIPSTINRFLEEGEVILVAKGVQHLVIGDRITYPSGAGIEQEYEGVKYKFLNGPTKTDQGDVWAIL